MQTRIAIATYVWCGTRCAQRRVMYLETLWARLELRRTKVARRPVQANVRRPRLSYLCTMCGSLVIFWASFTELLARVYTAFFSFRIYGVCL